MQHKITRHSRWRTTILATMVVVLVGVLGSTAGGASAAAKPIKIGFISTCKGPFAVFYEATLLGSAIALVDHGGTPGKKPSDGVKGLTIGGHPVQTVFGCSDATPDSALAEARRLIEQVGVDILVGPLSGSEGLAVANYSKSQPTKTFVNGTSAAQGTTLSVQSPNFFRFGTDGAQWVAGMGEYAYKTLGWRKVVTIGDDYDFPYAQNAGFVAEFCALGGKVTDRIWPPLGTTDYSSYIAQIPTSGIDGFFLTVGGTGTIAFVKAYAQLSSGSLSKKILWGSVAIDPAVTGALGDRVVGGVTGTLLSPDSTAPLMKKYAASAKKLYPDLAPFAYSLFSSAYWNNTWAALQGLKAVGGDLSDGQAKYRAALTALGKKGINTPGGMLHLDGNRNGVSNNYLIQLTSVAGGGAYKTLHTVPNVDQAFGGRFTPTTPEPSRTSPACKAGNAPPWVGKWVAGAPKK